MKRSSVLVAAVTLAASMTGCGHLLGAGGSSRPAADVADVGSAVGPDAGPSTESAPIWSCTYSVTYNDDWHDDVTCSNGIETERPYLRDWDSFVTYDEIMESAREYEAQLNG